MSSNQPAIEVADSVTEAVNESQQKPEKSKGSAVGFFLLGLVIILLGAAGGVAGFFFWQMMTTLQHEQQQIYQALEVELQPMDSLNAAIGELKKGQSELQQQAGYFKERVATVEKQSSSVLERVASIDGVNRNDWLIAEIEHYVKLANQRIELTHDPIGAANLLGQSAEVARLVEAPGVIRLREILLSDQHALNQASNIDIEGVYLELSILNKSLDKLQQPTFTWGFKAEEQKGAQYSETVTADRFEAGDEPSRVNIEGEGSEGVLKQGFSLSNAWEQWVYFVKNNLVRIRKVDEPMTGLAQPEEIAFLKQNLRLLIAQAQLAAMRGEGGNFKIALEQIRVWMPQYFDMSTAVAEDFANTLDRLIVMDIQPVLPAIDASINAVRDFKTAWQSTKQQSYQVSKPSTGGAQ